MLNFQVSNVDSLVPRDCFGRGSQDERICNLSFPPSAGGQGLKKSRHTAGFNSVRFWMLNLQNLGYQQGDGCRGAGKRGSAWLFSPSCFHLASCDTGLRARYAIPETSA
ncbi:MAG: hypothetical protein JWP69_303 [Flaviaesturariibacter sp.]|nr:hypothetical protein [Flaviaesturariibacter sp.]